MSDTVKLIIEIPKPMYESIQNGTYCGTLYKELKNGIPLDDVKAEFINSYPTNYMGEPELNGASCHFSLNKVLEILDNIGKTNKRSKIRCNTCKNSDDELSGECYECVKGIFDHYEKENKTEVENGRTND